MKKQRFFKAMPAVMLAATLMLLQLCCPGLTKTAFAAEGGKTISGLGTGAIGNPQKASSPTDPWRGSYVYYGKYGGNPVKYRALTTSTSDFGGTTMLLDCDSVLLDLRFDNDGSPNAGAQNANEWAYSDARANLNGDAFLNMNGVFTDAEKAAIAASTKTGAASGDGPGRSDLGFTALNGDKIFLLDVKEVTRESYGYETGGGTGSGRIKGGAKSWWWLRSPYSMYDYEAGCVYVDGDVISKYVDDGRVGVSPAFNVNLSSVIFSSEISSESGSYKLTLIDDNLKISTEGSITRNGKTITVPYSITGSGAGNATRVSVLMTDKAYTESTAAVKYYEELSGSKTFTLPDGYSDGWKVYILAEDVNGEKETDYASIPQEITIPAEHSHSWQYSVSGATITASCIGAGTCDIASGLNLTLSTPDTPDLVYDGSAKACALNVDYNQTIFSDGPYTIVYKGADGNSSNEAPTDAGSYTASVTAKDATATVSFAISPKPVSATVSAIGRSYEEGNTSVVLTDGAVTEAVSGDDVNIDISGASGEMADDGAGEGKSVTVTGVKLGGSKAGCYSLSGQPAGVTVTISKAQNPAVITDTAAVTVGGNTVSLSGNISRAKGSVSYAIDKDTTGGGCSVDPDTGLFTSGMATGECTVTVMAAGDGNHEAAAGRITVTVTDKLTQTLAFAESEVAKTVGDAPFINKLSGAVTDVSFAVTTGADVASVAEDGTVTILKAGEATITATAAETGEYARASAAYTLQVKEAASEKKAENQTEASGNTVPDTETREQKGASYYPLCARQKKVTKKAITITWKKVKGATSYTVYGCRCGKDKLKKLKTVHGTTYTQKKLKAGTYYKYFVVADSGEKVIAKSVKVHAATTGGRNGNPSSVKVNKKSVKMKVGKTWKIKATVKNKGRVSHHRPVSYETTNPKVAVVNKKGKVKAIAAGTCSIYVYEQNGICRKVKITVK